MNARDELADVFTGYPVGLGPSPAKLMRGHAQEIAEVILAAGYRKTEPEWGVRYDSQIGWIEQVAAGEAWARSIYKERIDEGAIAVVRRGVAKWEVA